MMDCQLEKAKGRRKCVVKSCGREIPKGEVCLAFWYVDMDFGYKKRSMYFEYGNKQLSQLVRKHRGMLSRMKKTEQEKV